MKLMNRQTSPIVSYQLKASQGEAELAEHNSVIAPITREGQSCNADIAEVVAIGAWECVAGRSNLDGIR